MPRRGVNLSPAAAAKQKEAIRKWQKENTTMISIRFKNEDAARYKAYAKKSGRSLAKLFADSVERLINEEDKNAAAL